MGISIAICEKDAPSAACAGLKKDIRKAMVSDIAPFGDAAIFDMVVSLDDAKAAFPDFEAFLKRNRINESTDAIYMEKVKKDDDRAILEPKAERRYTGWVDMTGMADDLRTKALELSKPENRVNGWDCLDFDEANKACAECPLSWDKGRGCIGAFGPDSTQLPEIAGRHGCDLVASVPELAKGCTILAPSDAEKLLKECATLADILPEEGKMAVRRYAGPVERMRLVAEISVKEGCGFYFF